MSRSWWQKLFRRKNTTAQRPKSKLDLNRARLEERLTPAFNMTVQLSATVGMSTVTLAGTTTFKATASGANLDWQDVANALGAGNNVVVDSGSTGTEAGNINVSAIGIGLLPGNQKLTFQSGSGVGLVGDISTSLVSLGGGAGNTSITIAANRNASIGTLEAGGSTALAAIDISAKTGSITGGTFHADSVSLSASTGIGASTAAVNTQASNLEAQTTTGGIFISNTGDLKIGGVSAILSGVQVTTSGDIALTNSGSVNVTLAGDTIKSVSGNISIAANGASSDLLTGGGNIPAIGATLGDITLNAGRDVKLGVGGFGDVNAVSGDISITAGGDFILDGDTFVIANGAGNIDVVASGNISLQKTVSGSVIQTGGSGSIGMTTGATGTFTADAGVGSSIKTNTGNMVLCAGDFVLVSTPIQTTQTVTLQQASTTARAIDLGIGTTVGALNLSAAEINMVSAGTLRIGRTDNAGDITLTGQIQPTGTSTLTLRTGGQILDGTATEIADITVTNLALITSTGIGNGNGNPIDIDATNLSFDNGSTGLVQIVDRNGGLTLKGVDGLTVSQSTSASGTVIKAFSPMTISMNVTTAGDFTATAGESAVTHTDNVTVDPAITVESTGGNIFFNAGDDIILNATSIVLADVGDIILTAANADADNEGILTLNGTISAGAIVTLQVLATNAAELPTVNSATEGATGTISSNGMILTSAASSRPFDLSASTTNAVGTLASNASAVVTYTDSTALTLGPVGPNANGFKVFGNFTSGHDFTVNAGGQITVNGTVSVGNATITLNATTGGATETAGITMTGTALLLTGAGTFTLDSANNDVDLFAASILGDLTYTDSDDLEITTVGTTSGITLPNKNLTVRVGGDLTLSKQVNIGSGTAIVATTAGGIIDNNGATNNFIAGQLALEAATGIGAADQIETRGPGAGPSTLSLAFNNTGGAVNIANTGELHIVALKTIDATSALNGSSNTGTTTTLSAASPLVFVANTISAGTLTATAGETADSPVFADDLSVNAGITVESTGGDVILQAGDDIILNALSLVKADLAGSTVTLSAGFGDTDGSGAISGVATHSVVATNLALSAIDGIGSFASPLTTTVSNLEAVTQTNGVFITNTGDLGIGGVDATIDGVQATTSGDVQLINTGSITLAGTAVEDIRANSGNVLVQAIGVAADIATRNSSADAIDSNNGNVSIDAGRDILLGDAVTDNFGDVEANGNVRLNAGRDVIVDEDAFLDAFGTGTMTVTAGRNISVVASDGTTGARITSEGGKITLTTGAGGVFTVGTGETVDSTLNGGNGDIQITADNMSIDGTIKAGTGCVFLQQVTLATVIDLGGADGAGTLGLTNTELGNITAAGLDIGQAGGGAITVTQKITLTVPLQLITGAGGMTDTGAGALEVDDLIIVSGGSVTLDGDNKVKNLSADVTGDLTFRDKIALTVADLTICGNNVTGVTATGDVTLIADAITINFGLSGDCVGLEKDTVGAATDLGVDYTDTQLDNITANVLRIGNAAAGPITISGNISLASANVPVLDLRSADSIANTGGTLTVDNLVFSSAKNVSLTDSGNAIGTAAGVSNGPLQLSNGSKLTIGTVTNCDGVAIAGINSTGNDITLVAPDLEIANAVTATGACVIITPFAAGKINLGSEVGGSLSLKNSEIGLISAAKLQIGNVLAGNITVAAAITPTPLTHLFSAGTISGTGAITTTNLALTADSVSLTGANDVDVLAGTSDKSFTFNDVDDLNVSAVAACVLTETGITSTSSFITLNTGAKLTSNANVTALTGNVTFNPTSGGVDQLAGSVKAVGLQLLGAGTFSLTGAANDVATIAAAVNGSVNYNDATALTVGSLSTGGIKTTNNTLTLSTGGALTIGTTIDVGTSTAAFVVGAGGANQTGGSILAQNLLLLVTGDTTLNSTTNDVDVLAGTLVGNLKFTDTDGFAIGQVNATKGISAVGKNVTLNTVTGTVTENAGMFITSDGLELLGTGTFTLTDANVVNNLAAGVIGSINVTDTSLLNIGTVNTAGIAMPGSTVKLIAAGMAQSATISAKSLDINGAGTFILGLTNNDVDTFTSNTSGGQVLFRDTDDLTIGAAGITTGNQVLTLVTGSSFTLPVGVTINLGSAGGAVFAGSNDPNISDLTTTVTLTGSIIADPVNGFRADGGIGSNTFVVTPSTSTPLFIVGHAPLPSEVSNTVRGDSLRLNTAALAATVGLFNIDTANGNGVFTFTQPSNSAVEVARPVLYFSIEDIHGLAIEAAAVQTAFNAYQIIATGQFNGAPFLGGFTGTLPPIAPFLVSPQFTNPVGPFTAPQVAVADVDGDSLPDLVIGFGLNSGSPLVTVVKGTRLFNSAKANSPLVLDDIMTQFFAYDPKFQGGAFVAAADLNGDGKAEIITGAGAGGGPHVKVFQIDATKSSNTNATVMSEFFAYQADFTGGVRVAAGDVTGDGKIDIVTTPGAGGGPHVRVFTPGGAVEREFFAYDAGFLGGVYVDVGDYNQDGFADILTGAGFSGGPHVRVFDGKTLTAFNGASLVLNEFFDDPPSSLNPTPFQDDPSALTAGVTGVGFGNFDDTTSQLDIFVGSGLGRRTRVRIYKNGSKTPLLAPNGQVFDFLSGGSNYRFDDRRDGAHVAVGAAFLT
ncbi:MAG: hypothetical protein ACJ8C4_11135 [Gemmataceae bacterium]